MRASVIRQLVYPLFRWLFRNPKYWVVVPLIVAVWYGYDYSQRSSMAYMGVPKVEKAPAGNVVSHILRKEGFMLEYSEGLKNPLWVTYKVGLPKYDSGKRPSRFQSDWRSWSRVTHDDYTNSGYDRGHMAPNYVIATRYGRTAQMDTFLMTNITPQKGSLNQKAWQRLEEVIANDFSQKFGEFWVVTGPIFGDKHERLNSGVAVPDAFFKILIKPSSKEQPARALAFIFQQTAKPRTSLMKFVTTIDEVEAQTGIDFFHELDDEFEQLLESSKTPEAWGLQAVATRPSRY